MKKLLTTLLLAGTICVVGCQKKPKEDLSKTPPPPPPNDPMPMTAPPPAPIVTEAPPPPPAPIPSSNGKCYVVKKGDTLSKIAREQLGGINHLRALIDANPGIDPNKIKVGQVINLP